MQPFNTHRGIVAVLERSDINTDDIIPKQFLKFIGKTGFGKYLFYDWRFLNNGQPNPDFPLNKPLYKGSSILLTGSNFGCGSSREHAPWSLLDYGFKVIIAPNFADIFWNNCLKNGLLPISVPAEKVADYMQQAKKGQTEFSIDLPNQTIIDSHNQAYHFDIDGHRKEFLVKGLDDIQFTLQFEKDITKFEQQQKQTLPWLFTAKN